MEEKKSNIILVGILLILMIIAIGIVIMNPNKIETTVDTYKSTTEDIAKSEDKSYLNEMNYQEENKISMQEGGTFCKIGNQIVFYEDKNKSIYMYNVEENTTKKIATLQHSINKMYFDGKNIYYIPPYSIAKGIYKVDLEGKVNKIYDGASLQLLLTDNEIYFVKQIGYDDFNHNPQGTICSMDKEGKNIIEIAKNIKNYFYMQNDKIYYTTQDRKMYEINTDGTNQTELMQGRKFTIGIADKYLLYIDYADQEAEHIYNLETKQDYIIGYFGILKTCQGKTYLNARKRLDDGAIETDYTLFEIEENASVKEIGKVANFQTDLEYISNGKVYIYSQQEGTYTINIENSQKENAEEYSNCRYFIGGYGYKIDNSNLEDIKVERIEL